MINLFHYLCFSKIPWYLKILKWMLFYILLGYMGLYIAFEWLKSKLNP